MSINLKNHSIIGCVIIGGLLFISLFASYVNVFTLLVCIYIVCMWGYEDCLCVIMFLISFERIFTLNLSGGSALINLVEVIWLLKLLYDKHFCIARRCGIMVAIFAAYAFIFSIDAGINQSISVVLTITLGLFILWVNEGKYNICRIYEYASAGVICSSFIGLLRDFLPQINYVGGSDEYIWLSKDSLFFRFSGLQSNPNYYTVLTSVLLAVFAVMLIQGCVKIIDFIFACALLVFGLMSVSMSFVLSLVVILFVALLVFVKRKPRIFVLGCIIMVASGILVFLLRNVGFISTIMYRIQGYLEDDDLTVASFTTGRSDIWLNYIKYIFANIKCLLIGVGIGKDASAIVYREAHSYFLEVVFYLGIIGSVLYIRLMMMAFGAKQYCTSRPKWFFYIPFIAFFFRCLARCLFENEMLIFLILLCSITVISFTNKDDGACSTT